MILYHLLLSMAPKEPINKVPPDHDSLNIFMRHCFFSPLFLLFKFFYLFINKIRTSNLLQQSENWMPWDQIILWLQSKITIYQKEVYRLSISCMAAPLYLSNTQPIKSSLFIKRNKSINLSCNAILLFAYQNKKKICNIL